MTEAIDVVGHHNPACGRSQAVLPILRGPFAAFVKGHLA